MRFPLPLIPSAGPSSLAGEPALALLCAPLCSPSFTRYFLAHALTLWQTLALSSLCSSCFDRFKRLCEKGSR